MAAHAPRIDQTNPEAIGPLGPPRERVELAGQLVVCAEICRRCARPGGADLDELMIDRCLDAESVCSAAAEVVGRRAPDAALLSSVLQVCGAFCRVTSEVCGELDDELSRRCAEVCAVSARQCAELLERIDRRSTSI